MKHSERAASVGRAALRLLGCLMAYSAVQHWQGGEALLRHYEASVLGARGLVGVAIAQTVVAGFLLWTRTQVVAALILTGVMVAATISHVRGGGFDRAGLVPAMIALWALMPALVILRHPPARA